MTQRSVQDARPRVASATLARRAVIRQGIQILPLAALMAAACGSTATVPETSGTSQQPVKVKFGTPLSSANVEREAWTKQTIARFNELNGPNVTVEFEVLGQSLQAPQLQVMLASGTGPDITQASGSWFSDFADKGAFGDLTAFAKRDKIDPKKWYWQDEVFIYKGKQYGMPFWQSPGAYFYNATLFKRRNVSLPTDNWTWDDMLEAAKKLNSPGESWGIQTAYGWEKSWLQFVRAAGGDYINQERTKTTCNSPVAIEAMQWVADLVLKHRVMAAQGDTSVGEGNLWNQGKVGILVAGVNVIASTVAANPGFEWDLFLTPKHPKTGKRVVTTNDNPMVVMTFAKERDAAWKFDLFMAEKFAQDLEGALRLNMPVLKTSAADPQGWLKPPPANIRLTNEYMAHGTYLSFHKNWLQWYNETQTQILPAFKGEISVKEALDKAAQVGDTLLRGL